MRLLLLLLLSITNIYAQEKVLGVDIPKDFIVDYDEWDNIYDITSSNIKESQEEFQKKGFLENSYLIGKIGVIGDTNVYLVIDNFFWKGSEYQNQSEGWINAIFYIKNNDKILKKEIGTLVRLDSGCSRLRVVEALYDDLELSFIIDNLNENSTLRIKDFADNIFEYEGEELKPLLDTIKLYKKLKKEI